MKVRAGFVSNSSSSSFLFMTTKEIHDMVFQDLNDYEKKIIEEITDIGEFLGKEVVYVGDLNVMDYSRLFENLERSEDDKTDPHEAFDKYATLVRKKAGKSEVFQWDMDG